MQLDRRPGLRAGAQVLSLVVLTLLASATACAMPRTLDAPAVDRLARSVLRYRSPELEMVVGTNPAQMAVGEERWLVLHVGISGARRIATRLDREGLTLRLPSGQMLPLASQSELAAGFDGIEPFLRRAAIASPPLQYYVGSRAACAVPFFAEPNRGIVSSTLFVNDRQFCTGFLYFYTDDSVRPGTYELHVATKNGDGKIAFELLAAAGG